MRKKILAAIIAATMPEVMNASSKNSGKERTTRELLAEETLIEKVSIEEISTEEVATEEILIEDVLTEETTTEENPIKESVIEIQSMFKNEFEGKYWLRYSDYGHKGLYFDGSKAISMVENQGIFEKDYFVEDDLINIGGEYYIYEIKEGKLGLALARDVIGVFSYYDEVEKAEYDGLFTYYFKM